MNWNAGERFLQEQNHIRLEDGTINEMALVEEERSADSGVLLLDSKGFGIDRFEDGISKYMLEDASSDVMLIEDANIRDSDGILFESNTKMISDDITAGYRS